MKIQPLMLAGAIAFWGGQTGQWIVAVPVALIVGAAFYVPLRWELTITHITRVADFCTVLSLLFGTYLYLTYGNPRAIILLFQWLPLMFLPLALAHAYGTAERMNLSVLFWSLRRRPPARPATFDPWWPYYALWIVAAAAANSRGEWFYIGLVALVSWPLVRVRPWSYRVGTWGVAFSIAIGLGYASHFGLNTAQGWLEAAVPEWISSGGSRTDPYRATTDIGHIGKLKESDAIVLRVSMPSATIGAKPPELLHRASYNTYFGISWIARAAAFSALEGGRNNHWLLSADAVTPASAVRVTIHDYSARPNPLLSLPTGALALEELKAISAQRNALGALQIVRDPGYFSYVVAYAGGHALEGPPTTEDTRVPAKEREAFQAVATELGLTPSRADDAIAHVKLFFANGYRYATFQNDTPLAGSPMVDFLHRSKSGHCEYFATATVLLLRAGGIPARYATGFAVIEKSEREDAYLVRTRHAHAWVRAFVNGAWVDIDTTPPSWISIEAEGAGIWSAIVDRWSWLHFRASQAWANSDERKLLIIAAVVAFPFGGWLAWRLFRSRSKAKNSQQNQIVTVNNRGGSDSDFYPIEQRLAEQGWGRRPHETNQDWMARLNGDAIDARLNSALLARVVDLHNRHRFDPQGLDETQRAQLKMLASEWLAGYAAAATATTT